MAERNFWTIVNGKISKGLISFKWEPGMSTAQKRRSCVNLHSALNFYCDLHALDISSASTEKLGVSLSAFNLKWRDIPIECWYQGSKVYADGKLNHHLYNATSLEAKLESKNKGSFIGFNLGGREFPTDPRTVFYDYLYLLGMCDTYGYDLDLSAYDCFTDVQAVIDIDACQARAVCLYKLLQQQDKFRILNVFDDFLYWHEKVVEDSYQFEHTDNWLKPVEGYDDLIKCLNINEHALRDLCKTQNLKYEHVSYATYRISSYDVRTLGSDWCIVYSDLLLDDLCALEELSRHYDKLHLVAINSEQLCDTDYASARVNDIRSAGEVLSKWFKAVEISRESLSHDEIAVDNADCYLLANASKIVEDLKAINIRFNKVTAMIGSDHDGRNDDQEWNASQDINAYVEFCKHMDVNIITYNECISLYNKYGYHNNNYEFLDEYVSKMKSMNEDIACFDLQAVIVGLGGNMYAVEF